MDALAVPYVGVLAREVEVGRAVLYADRNRLGQTSRRVDRAEQHVGDRATTGLAEQGAIENGRNRIGHRLQAQHTSVGQDDDGPRLHLRDRSHEI